MLRNYIKIAWRNLLKNRTFSIINIVGLSFSVAFCLLLLFYIRHEQSFESFHEKKDRLYRMEMTNTWPSDKTKTTKHWFPFFTGKDEAENATTFPVVVGIDMKAHFPEIKSYTRFQVLNDHLIKVGKDLYKEKSLIIADDNFFSNFSFHLKKGNATTVLASPGNVVISESTAKKYFGNEDPIGKTIELAGGQNQLFTVSGVTEDAPYNSSIQFGLVIPMLSDPDYKERIDQHFNQSSHLLIIELNKNVSATQFEAKMNAWVKKYYTEPFVAENGKYYKDFDFGNFKWYMRPLAECHYNASGNWGHFTDAKSIYELSCIVIIILLIASLNYVLLAISNAAARSQEVGVRKVMGANRRSIILQFWVETQIVVVIAVLLGFVLTSLLLPFFNSAIDSNITMRELSFKEIIPAIVLLTFLLGIIAGYYPALLISKLKAVSIIKSFRTFKINPRFSRVMVVMQYTACVALMIAAFIINRQMHFIHDKNLGFDKEQVLMVRNPSWDWDFTKRVRGRLKDFASRESYISAFSGMNGGLTGSYNTNGFRLNGEQQWRKQLTVDYGYFEMLNLKFVQGRAFSQDIASDSSKQQRTSIVNESLFNLLGKTAKLGEFCEPINAIIIGVVKDYHFETLSKKIEPEEHVLTKGYEMYFMFKIKGGQMQHAIAEIEKEWKVASNNYPFEYTFLDESINKMYEADMRWQKIIQASCFFAIFIACMGLFGLSAINAINRTKEIGIRKVLGASVQDIVTSLSTGFLAMVAIAIVIATPLTWWVMNSWLDDFAYRINISWWMFAVTGFAALVIALATVSYQAIKAALVNPVKSLRNE